MFTSTQRNASVTHLSRDSNSSAAPKLLNLKRWRNPRVLPQELILWPGTSAANDHAYLALVAFAHRDQVCRAPIAKLAEAANMTPRNFRKHLAHLKAAGLVAVQYQPGRASEITLLHHPIFEDDKLLAKRPGCRRRSDYFAIPDDDTPPSSNATPSPPAPSTLGPSNGPKNEASLFVPPVKSRITPLSSRAGLYKEESQVLESIPDSESVCEDYQCRETATSDEAPRADPKRSEKSLQPDPETHPTAAVNEPVRDKVLAKTIQGLNRTYRQHDALQHVSIPAQLLKHALERGTPVEPTPKPSPPAAAPASASAPSKPVEKPAKEYIRAVGAIAAALLRPLEVRQCENILREGVAYGLRFTEVIYALQAASLKVQRNALSSPRQPRWFFVVVQNYARERST
jgi:DNA-binding transcriptional ArsR family regulator